MDLYDAQQLAKELMDKHGLTEQGWTFKWMKQAKEIFGKCNHTRKQIYLGMTLTRLSPESEVRDTILHEIAHALVPAVHGHDLVWKQKCIEIGARPQRCGNGNYREVTAAWTARCERGHEGPRRHRQPTDLSICTKCHRLVKESSSPVNTIFNWYKNDKLVPLEKMSEAYQRRHAIFAKYYDGR